MDPADLVAIEEIKRLKYRYMRCLDQKRWDEIAGCFAPDATAAYGGGKWTFQGRDAIVEFLSRSMGAESFLSCHRVSHPEIDLEGADAARGTWALEDTVIETRWGITIRGAAFYEDRYVRSDAGWRIAHTGYKRTYEEIQPRAGVEGLRLTAHWWATAGRSELEVG